MRIRAFCIFLILSVVQAGKDCTTSYCDRSAIKPPFSLQGQQPQECDSPGFNLSCNEQKKVILNLPYSGNFYVDSIYYSIKIITLSDPKNCLPRRLLSLNLSSSPFMAFSYQNYTFLNCPKDQVTNDCVSNSTTIILAVKYPRVATRWSICKEIATLPIPVSPYFNSDIYEFPLSLDLTWNDSTTCISCNSAIGGSKQMPVAGIVIMSFLIPLFVIYCICRCVHMARQGNYQASESNQTSARAALSDIATYKTIVVGEGIITEPYDATCTICLTDYLPKDTVMLMPQCKHCFHIECITRWFITNNNCPICRASQTHNNPC